MANEENECNGLIVAINQRLVMENVQDSSAESGCFAQELRISKSTGCKKLSVFVSTYVQSTGLQRMDLSSFSQPIFAQ